MLERPDSVKDKGATCDAIRRDYSKAPSPPEDWTELVLGLWAHSLPATNRLQNDSTFTASIPENERKCR